MSKFKEALERGKEAHRQQDRHDGNERAEGDASLPDFVAQARAWLNEVVVRSLEAAKADVAGEVAVDIDTAPGRHVKTTPSIRFQIYRKRELGKVARRTFTVNVE